MSKNPSNGGGYDENQEELSIFQSKNVPNIPKLDLQKLQQQETDQREYTRKLEQSVQYLNEKLQKARIDYKNQRKEN